jgi:hypothetical protein
MKTVAGSLIVLAGAVLAAAGTVANALTASANRGGEIGTFAIVAGAFVGAVGFTVFAINHRAESKPPAL